MPVESAPLIDLSQESPAAFKEKIGELAQLSLQRSGACILLARGLREVTIIDPAVLDLVPEADMAAALLDTWTEAEILRYLELREARLAAGVPR